jgi:hypothetical protein
MRKNALVSLAMGLGLLLSGALALSASDAAGANQIIAVDILLKPDEALAVAAKSVNVRLRRGFPAGFSLDRSHATHISLLQVYIHASDLERVEQAVALTLKQTKLSSLHGRAGGYETTPWSGLMMVSIGIKGNRDLMKFQSQVTKAVAAFSVSTGTADAFFTDADAPTIDAQTIAYVENFIPTQTGAKYKPHVSVGVAPHNVAQNAQAQTWRPFDFGVKSVAIYQLGNYCTARKRLWQAVH